MHLEDKDTLELLERVSAATIANQAILKCAFARVPLTVGNVLRYVGDFFDPANEDFAGITLRIEEEIAAVVEVPRARRDDPSSANEPRCSLSAAICVNPCACI
jgi:hypothetical protein